MGKFQNNNGCSVEIKPFMDYSFSFKKLKLHEAIGGSIAQGTVDFEFPNNEISTDLIASTNYLNIRLEQSEGSIYNINALIVSKKIIDNQVTLDFSCIKDMSFISETLSLEFTDINEAIEYSYQGHKDIRCESDLSNDLNLIQFQETSHNFCTRIAKSFKYDSLFAFGLEGFIIKDTIIGKNSKGNIEKENPIVVIAGTGSIMQESLPKSNLNPQYYKKPFDSWNETMEGEEINDSNKTEYGQDEYSVQSTYGAAIVSFNKYSLVHKNFLQLRKNADYNDRYYKSSYYSNLSISNNDRIPEYKLGDIVYYINSQEKDIKNPNNLYIVYENDILITSDSTIGHEGGKGFAWRTFLKGIENGKGEVLDQLNNPGKKS